MCNNLKQVNRLRLFFVTMTMLIASVLKAEIQTGPMGDNVTYTWDSESGEVVISGTGEIWNYSYDWASPLCTLPITSIIIEEGVTSIGNYAFSGWMFTSITIPNTVTSIGNNAFWDCDNLTSVILPNSLISIGYSVFEDCLSLTSISVDPANPNFSSIDGVFFNKDQSRLIFYPAGKQGEYIIPTSVSSIADYAFYVPSITSLTIPNSITSISRNAFCGCFSLTTITVLADTPPHVFDDTFEFSDILYVPAGTKAAYAAADGWKDFSQIFELEPVPDYFTATNSDGVIIRYHKLSETGCEVTSLKDGEKYGGAITIPATVSFQGRAFTVTAIGNDAFYECTSLTSVTLPNSVTKIGDKAFDGCTNLGSFPNLSHIASIGFRAFARCSKPNSITIPKSVTNIGEGAFSYCGQLRINVEAGNQYYDSRDWCNALFCTETNTLIAAYGSNMNIPTSVTSIGYAAFGGCSDLTSIVIPPSVTSIGHEAFSQCPSLSEVTIFAKYRHLPAIESDAFDETPISTATLNVWMGSFFYDENILEILREFGSIIDVDNFEFTEGLWVEPNEFDLSDCSVSGMRDGYYSGDIDIPSGISYWGYPLSITSIYDGTFSGSFITSISIPNSVRYIYDASIIGCTSLTSITVDQANPSFSSHDGVLFNKDKTGLICYPGGKQGDFTIPSSVTSINPYAFSGCVALNSIAVDQANPYFSSQDGALFNKDKTRLICCPGGKQGNYIIPSSVTVIDQDAFSWCTSLSSVTVLNDTPPSFDDRDYHYFDFESPLSSITLYVPAGTKTAYAAADTWKDFGSIIELEPVPDYFTAINSDGVTISYHKLSETECEVTSSEDYEGYSGDIAVPATVFYAGHTLTVTAIGYCAFYQCEFLTSISLPNSLTSIEDCAFMRCSSLTSVSLPSSVTTIGGSAFHECTNLTDIDIPDSVTSIGLGAFKCCI